MATTLGGITYVHAIQYFEKGIDSQGPFYNVEYQIDDWADSDNFVNYLQGIGADGPHRYPLSPNLACHSAVAIGMGRPTISANGTPSYADGAIIRATYRSGGNQQGGSNLTYDDPLNQHQIDPATPLVYCTQELDFETEAIQFSSDEHGWKWATAPKDKVKFAIQMNIPVTTLVLTFHRRQFIPMGQVAALRGRINSVTFLGQPAETVWFLGAKTTRDYSTDGTIQQKVQLVFKSRDDSWNKFPRMQDAALTWDYVEAPTGGQRRYKLADLTPLIRI